VRRVQRILTITLVAWLSVLLLSPVVEAQTTAQTSSQEEWPQEWLEEWLGLPGDLPEDWTEFPNLNEAYARGTRALEKLGHRLPAVARAHGLALAQLQSMLRHDQTLFLDGTGQLVYFDELAPGEPAPVANAAPALASSPTPAAVGPQFELASNPGAAKTIYLDFNGHVTQGTTWNSQNNISTIVSGAYDTDGNPSNFSASELNVIARSWEVVAEDYAPWDVNVTTIDPGSEALRRSGAGDNSWGVRVVITQDNIVNCGCGGAAYIGSFDDPADEPAFVFNTNFTGVSEAISHEVGHSLGLAHDGDATGGYYRGHDDGTIGWAPIMGSSYWEPVTQWSQQEYSGATNTGADANFGRGRDDIAIISSLTNGNNFGLKADDHGDTSSSATVLSQLDGTIDGLISTRQDRDVFAFTTTGSVVEFAANPAPLAPNLDISLTVRDGFGSVIATSNPVSLLSAAISVELDAGDYTVEVDGVGIGTPGAASPSGYSDYASLGQYTLAASESPIFALGDVNCDGRSTIADALFVSQFAVGNRTASAQCPLADPTTQIYAPNADVNSNNRVTVADALMISQCSAGIPNALCPEGN